MQVSFPAGFLYKKKGCTHPRGFEPLIPGLGGQCLIRARLRVQFFLVWLILGYIVGGVCGVYVDMVGHIVLLKHWIARLLV